jgi:transcription elongation GreA/GreB family factor
MQSLKAQVKQAYLEAILNKIQALQGQKDDIMESLRQETKSTAGDKYETSRAMLHIEQGNIESQLSVLLQQKAILESISTNEHADHSHVQFGNLVQTNKGYIFVAAALGKIMVDGQTIFAISPESPLGKLLIGKTIDAVVNIQSARYTIEVVL